jgi:hypothetical protein
MRASARTDRKKSPVKLRTATVVVASVGILLAATACSSGGSSTGSGSSATPAASKTAAASSKTYTADDLPAILTTAEKKVGLSGTILDNEQVQAKIKQAGGLGGISSLLGQTGVKFSPASCGQLIKDNLSTTPPADSIDSILTYGTNSVTVTSIAGKKLPATFTSDQIAKQAKVISQCGSMKISVIQSGQTISIPLTLKKVSVSTDAEKTNALEETITTPSPTGGAGTPVAIRIITAVQGNLLIVGESSSASATTTASTPSASPAVPIVDVINAVVAAAK